jgi:phosphoenolpyruvate carboxykinase (GTP)
LDFGRKISNPPLIFKVNWFRLDENGNFLWPGFGDNMRVLHWIIGRAHGKADAVDCPLGWMPCYDDLILDGLDDLTVDIYKELQSVNKEVWLNELKLHDELFEKMGDKLPKEMPLIRDLLQANLERSPEHWTVPA